MSYINEGCDKYTSSEIRQWITGAEKVLEINIEHNKNKDRVEFIQSLRQQLLDLHADLILKRKEEKKEREQQLTEQALERALKQAEAKEKEKQTKIETNQLLSRLLQMVESL